MREAWLGGVRSLSQAPGGWKQHEGHRGGSANERLGFDARNTGPLKGGRMGELSQTRSRSPDAPRRRGGSLPA